MAGVRQYAHLFFDLDHTLWDFRSNSRETLTELYAEERLQERGVGDLDEFIGCYEEVNEGLWGRYEAGNLPKEVLRVLRFRNTLIKFGVKDEKLVDRLGDQYLQRCPLKPHLMPGAKGLLQDLSAHYRLHVITNGFDEVQSLKIESSGITHFFSEIITSERAGARKPDPRIFGHAQELVRGRKEDCFMVGDNPLADMLGARQAGWDHAHFAAEVKPDEHATYRVQHLDELRPILH
jgi:putative hydrolase of the HAD superfamily